LFIKQADISLKRKIIWLGSDFCRWQRWHDWQRRESIS